MTGSQHTLDGRETDRERSIPGTYRKCAHCEEYVLRSGWDEHADHDREERERIAAQKSGDSEAVSEKPEIIGNWYTVELHRSVEYRFHLPAYDKHRAKKLAEEWSWDATPADEFTVHTRVDEGGEITTEDLPEDFDIYGGDALWEAFEDG